MAEIISYSGNNNIIRDKSSGIGKCKIDGCTKKLGLIPFICRCKKEYCVKHRLPETHNCVFNYKIDGKKKMEEENKCIAFEKILKI